MKYAWFCAHCGVDCFFTDKLPVRGTPVFAADWTDVWGKPAKEGIMVQCYSCKNALLSTPAYTRALPAPTQPQTFGPCLASGNVLDFLDGSHD